MMKRILYFLACIMAVMLLFLNVNTSSETKDANKKPTKNETKKTFTSYEAKDFSNLLGMPGFSDNALKIHFKLYEGYVKNTNTLLEKIAALSSENKGDTPEYAEMKRRFGWEFDGMRLHEYYFGGLGKVEETLAQDSPLYKKINEDFGSFDKWKDDFVATGKMRGSGWAILYLDMTNGKLINVWINEHNTGHLAGCKPILVMDVFEHAYMLDYGTERGKYIDAFFKNINWKEIEKRYSSSNMK